jgi:hypothetical protein
VSPGHVEALNMIDLEFCGRKLLRVRWQSESEKATVQAWSFYRDSLHDPTNFKDEAGFKRREAAFVDLLFGMSRDLGYDFDKVYLGKSAYSPVAHSDLELDQHVVRKGVIDVLEGRRPISIAPWVPGDTREIRRDGTAASQEPVGKPSADTQRPPLP